MTDSILTVISAASSYDLTDLATAKDELDITVTTYDPKLSRWITSISKRLAKICNVVFPEEALSETYRLSTLCQRYQVQPLVLSRRPITYIDSVTVDGSTLTEGTDFESDTASGLLYRLSGGTRTYWSGTVITVLYTAGYYPIPEDLERACLAVLRHQWATTGRDPTLKRERSDFGELEYWGASTSDPLLSAEIQDLLRPYREYSV